MTDIIPKQEMTLVRTFDAPLDKVWKAWTDPAQIAQWWGPKDFTNPVCVWEPKPGGKIYVEMTWPNGTPSPMGGMFQEVIAMEKLVFLSNALNDEQGNPQLEGMNTITFEEKDGKTIVTVSSTLTKTEGMAKEAAKGQKEGWSQSLDKLADLLKA